MCICYVRMYVCIHRYETDGAVMYDDVTQDLSFSLS